MMGRWGLIEENAKHPSEPGTTHSQANQHQALGSAGWRSQTPHQKEPNTQLEPAVERTNLCQRTRISLELRLLREERRSYEAPDARKENKHRKGPEQDTFE
jgi:hypothetical protein